MANWSVNTDTQVAHSPPSYHSHVGTLIGLAMRSTKIGLALLVAFVLGCQTAAFAGDDGRSRDGKRWWRGEWKEEFWDGPCEVKIESKRGEFKREIKCKDGIGAQWRGEWKKEFRDGPCLVKQEAKRDEFKEEVKCERRK